MITAPTRADYQPDIDAAAAAFAQDIRSIMREADVANPTRTGGPSRWTDEEQKRLDDAWDVLCDQFPDRTRQAVARRLIRFEEGRS